MTSLEKENHDIRNKIFRNKQYKKWYHENDPPYFIHMVRFGPSALEEEITLMRQGFFCKDCKEQYTICECEDCPDCKFNRCLCSLDIIKNINDIYTAGERIKVSKIFWELSKIMNEDYNECSKNLMLKRLHYEKKYIMDFEIWKNFIESLTPDSSFPEYRIIAINLLEIEWVK